MAEQVVAEIVATVLEVNVALGDSVEPGQQVLLLESMKMEIPVVAEDGGVVSAVGVAAGDVIKAGDELVTLD